MTKLMTYSLEDFILFSGDASQAMFQSYNKALWPLHFIIFFISLLLLFYRLKHPKKTLLGLSLVWLIPGLYFNYKHFLSINWSASWLATLMTIQAVVMFLFMMTSPVAKIRAPKLGIFLFLFSVLVPYSLFLPLTKDQVVLFGWGVSQTCLGTLAFLTLFKFKQSVLTLMIIPFLILFYFMGLNWVLSYR